jgi:hypothetical protein
MRRNHAVTIDWSSDATVLAHGFHQYFLGLKVAVWLRRRAVVIV